MNQFIQGWLILYWLFFAPKHWKLCCKQIELSETCNFSLFFGQKKHSKNSLRRFVINTFISNFCLLFVLIILTRFIYGQPVEVILFALFQALSIFLLCFLAAWLLPIIFTLPLGFGCALVLGLAHGEHNGIISLWGVVFCIMTSATVVEQMQTTLFSSRYWLQQIGIAILTLCGWGAWLGIGLWGCGQFAQWMSLESIYGYVGGTAFMLFLPAIWYILRRTLVSILLAIIAALLFLGVFEGLLLLRSQSDNASTWNALLVGVTTGLFHVVLGLLLFYTSWRLAGLMSAALSVSVALIGLYGGWFVYTETYAANILLWGTGLSILAGLGFNYWRPLVFYPFQLAWHILLYRQNRPLHWHAAFWDEHQSLPLVGLDDWLLKHYQQQPEQTKQALAQLAQGKQAWAVTAVSRALDKQALADCDTVSAIAALADLSNSQINDEFGSLLRSFLLISQDVRIALAHHNPYYRQQSLSALLKPLEALFRDCLRTSSGQALAAVAQQWQAVLQQGIAQETQQQAGKLLNPYVVGNPLGTHQQTFVGRHQIVQELEHLLHKPSCPPLLLYGQRRMGKTSIFYHLPRLLPRQIVPLKCDMQGRGIRSERDFFYTLCRDMCRSAQSSRALTLPEPDWQALQVNPVRLFDEWLDAVLTQFPQQQFLLMLDEIIALKPVFDNGELDRETVLGALRHQIQHRFGLKLLIAASLLPEELPDWASYLVNIRTLLVDCLDHADVETLVRRPVADFNLAYSDAAFTRVWQLTRGHPAFTQALCDAIVEYKNRQALQQRFYTDVEDVEVAIETALQNTEFFWREILRVPDREKLRQLAQQGENVLFSQQDLHDLNIPAESLAYWLRRDLFVQTQQQWHFKIELIRRACYYPSMPV